MNMKRSTQDVIMVSLLVIVVGFGCYLWGSYNANGKALLIQDAEKVQKIPGVTSISIYNWYGNWDIQFDLETKCGKTRIKSGDQSTLKEAIDVAKTRASCFDSCGGK